MNRLAVRPIRFAWRAARNLVCAVPGGKALLFPTDKLARRFGRGDAEYAVEVYVHHAEQLAGVGFTNAASIFETGPGRNLGSALLWWCRASADATQRPVVTLWDIFGNANPQLPGYWRSLAQALLPVAAAAAQDHRVISGPMLKALEGVAAGTRQPAISYVVCKLANLQAAIGTQRFDLLLSHAALEHVWQINDYWRVAAGLGNERAWQSHRIDLADHGRRNTNYLEMLEWSPHAWWLTMRLVPGALNRWRAQDHRDALERNGWTIVSDVRELRSSLPGRRSALAAPYRDLPSDELRATAVDLVAYRESRVCMC